MLSAKELKNLSSLKQKKYREREGKFLIEGFHLIEECLSSSFYLEKIIVSKDADETKLNDIRTKFKTNFPSTEEIPPVQFKKLSETENPQGIIGVVNIPHNESKLNTTNGNLILALDRINDPGNMGTIIRTAYWFNADKILISRNSADIYNSKVIRSSQGGIFHSNIQTNVTLEDELQNYRNSGYDIYLLTLDSDIYLDEISTSGKSVLVTGNEAEGISGELMHLNFNTVKIRGYSKCESLNAAVSTAIVLNHFRTACLLK